ncbi:hypothetical protein NDU88_006249 [Pleurodeles waltl]|uniref:Uncharacterized protein n=1 Tax=Pleurodeles waltl TaxID=8319 RepID=A0AAV7TWN7_PLEWA|nr:hypothetical protein NDU88_006249 [Pleurodeles waltl]
MRLLWVRGYSSGTQGVRQSFVSTDTLRRSVREKRVRRALLRAEPELPWSRLRAARAAHTRRLESDGDEAARQTRLRH